MANNIMEQKTYTLRFRASDNDVFQAIKTGKKKVETRAGTKRYQHLKKGDLIIFVCGKTKFKRHISKIKYFSSLGALLKDYKPSDVHPDLKTANELEKMYYSFPGYREKIKKYGLVAIEFLK